MILRILLLKKLETLLIARSVMVGLWHPLLNFCLSTVNPKNIVLRMGKTDFQVTTRISHVTRDIHSVSYVTRLENKAAGQYIVSLPWKSRDQLTSAHLESSHSVALRALNRLEANFAKDEKLKVAYAEFIKESIDLGHMPLSSNFDSLPNNPQAFLPHHGVWKETSTTTKLRTVFNGSSKTETGVSVNNLLHVGPNLLQNPVALIFAWRRYKIVLSADVEKMF